MKNGLTEWGLARLESREKDENAGSVEAKVWYDTLQVIAQARLGIAHDWLDHVPVKDVDIQRADDLHGIYLDRLMGLPT